MTKDTKQAPEETQKLNEAWNHLNKDQKVAKSDLQRIWVHEQAAGMVHD